MSRDTGQSRPVPAASVRRWAAAGVLSVLGLPAATFFLPGWRGAVHGPGSRAVSAVRPAVPHSRGEDYVGSLACAACHARESARHRKSRHARTLSRADVAHQARRFEAPGSVRDPVHALDYQTMVDSEACVLVAIQGARSLPVAARYAVGSGKRGTTYLGSYAGETVELRLSYYAGGRGWDFTPGQQVGMPFAGAAGRTVKGEAECFQCHATGKAEESRGSAAQPALLGVGCEACHGPGRDHIQTVGRGDSDLRIARLSHLEGAASPKLCGACHHERGAPGAGARPAEEPPARLQAFALSRSACFRKSGGRLSCMTCHDPHGDADDLSRSDYNAKCGGCHSASAADAPLCRLKPGGDCVSCHMPGQAVPLYTRPRFRTHWIRVWSEAAVQRAAR